MTDTSGAPRRLVLAAGLSGLAVAACGPGVLDGPGRPHAAHAARLARGAVDPVRLSWELLRRARTVHDACRYGDAARHVARLTVLGDTAIADLPPGHRAEQGRAAVAHGHTMAAGLACKYGDDHAGLDAARTATRWAAGSGDADAVVAAARAEAVALRHLGDTRGALHALDRARATVGALRPGDAGAVAEGLLWCTSAYTAAQGGRAADAAACLDRAYAVADRLGPGGASGWGRLDVDLFAVGTYTAFGEPDVAVARAAVLPASRLPTVERQARYLLDAARAHHAAGSMGGCHRALSAVARLAPQEVRRPSVAVMVPALLSSSQVRRADAVELARWVGPVGGGRGSKGPVGV